MEQRESFTIRGYGKVGKNMMAIKTLLSDDKLKMWDLVGLNAKMRCLRKDKIEVISINDAMTKEDIGKIVKIIYNEFNGIKKTIEMDSDSHGENGEKIRISIYLDIEDDRITDGRIVFSKDEGLPFRLYEIENLIVGKNSNRMIRKNIVLIIMKLLGERGYSKIDVDLFIQGYLKAINDIRNG